MNVSVIISTMSSDEAALAPLRDDLARQTLRSLDVVVVRDVRPSGRARNAGARQAQGDVFIFLDDDVRLGDDGLCERMVSVLSSPPAGMVGAAQLLPPESSPFQQRAGREIPRMTSSLVPVVTESDMVTTACCAIRRDLFWELGGFNENIPRGVDPEFRHRLRHRGYQTLVAPGAWFYHPVPADLLQLGRLFFRNGRQTAAAVRMAPWVALENPDGHVAEFVERRSMAYRILRHLHGLAWGVARRQWVGVAARGAYIAGYFSFAVINPRRADRRPGGLPEDPTGVPTSD